MVYYIANGESSRLYQFGATCYFDEAQRLLRKADARYPDALCHIESYDEKDDPNDFFV